MPRQYQWVTAEMVEQHFTETVAEFFRSYPDPVPQYQYLDGLRGRGLLESALAEPRQTFEGRYLHRTVFDKSAALWRSLTLNHPFVDGNKRMGFICCLMFLGFNGYFVIAQQDEVEEMCVFIATGGPAPRVADLSSWLRRNTIPVDKAVRLLTMLAAKPDHWQLAQEMVQQLTETNPPAQPPA